jgi:hypothetical protein
MTSKMARRRPAGKSDAVGRRATIAFVRVLFSTLTMSLPDDRGLRFVIKMALRNALKLVRGLRKQITELDEDVMARALSS